MKELKQSKRRGNPGTPPDVINAIRFLKEKYPDVSAKVICQKLGGRLAGKKSSLPTERTVRNILARSGSLKQEDIDGPWSLGASASYDIPAEASSDLLKIWKWSVMAGRNFTIREAKWAARLRSIVRFENLLFFASMYAIQERMCKDNKKFNTSNLDAWLIFERSEVWIYHLLVISGKFAGIFGGDKLEEFYGNAWLDWIGDPGKSIEGILNISPKHIQTLSKEADMVYAFWLRLLSRGPRWDGLTDEAKNSIAQRLHNEVPAKESMIRRALTSDKKFLDILAGEREYVGLPSKELLKEAGIEEESKKSGNKKDQGTPASKQQLTLIPEGNQP